MHRRELLRLAAMGASGVWLGCGTTAPRRPPTRGTEPPVLAIQGFLDDEHETLVREIWRKLEDGGVPVGAARSGARPHMTLASWRVGDPTPDLVARLDRTARTLRPQPVTLTLTTERDSGLYDSGLYLVPPAADNGLHAFHARLHESMGEVGPSYRKIDLPGQWQPHVSVVYGFPAALLPRAQEICAALPVPFEARIDAIGFVTFGPTRHPATFRLSGS